MGRLPVKMIPVGKPPVKPPLPVLPEPLVGKWLVIAILLGIVYLVYRILPVVFH